MDTPLAAVVHKENEHFGGGKATVTTMKSDQLKTADKECKSMLQGFEKGNEHSCDLGKGVELWYIRKKANVHRRCKLILSEMIASDSSRSLVAKFEESSASEQKDNETDPGLFSVLDTPKTVDRFWLEVYRPPRIPQIKSGDDYEEFNSDDKNDGIKSENPVF